MQPAAARARPTLDAAEMFVGDAPQVTDRLGGDEADHHLAAQRRKRGNDRLPLVAQRRCADQRDARRVPVAAPPEVPGEQRRHQELHDGAAGGADELPERSEHQVPALVDRQVDAVQQGEAPRVAEVV